MERVFAKYDNFKNVVEDLLGKNKTIFRQLIADGLIHFFDGENLEDSDIGISHRLNIGVYEDPAKVTRVNSINTIYIDNRLSSQFINNQIQFFCGENAVILDVAFGLQKQKFDEFKRGVKELKNIENILSKVHDEYVPLRTYQFKNCKFFSKYFVGQSLGGDYFDIEEVNKKIYLSICSFNSYIKSVNYIKESTSLKENGGDVFESFEKYFEGNQQEISSVFFCELDPLKLIMKYISWGPQFNTSSEIKSKTGTIQLKAGDLIYFGSKGFKDQVFSQKSINKLFSNPTNDGIKKTFNEVFSYLNSTKQGRFLDVDATLVCLEVNSNIIKEV